MNLSYEALGLTATLFVIIAFAMKGEKRIRQFDLIGATLFVIYGMAIGSVSTIVLNMVLCGIQVGRLHSLYTRGSDDK